MAVAVAMSAQWQEAANSGRVGSEGLVGVDVRPKTMVRSAQSSSQATKRPDDQNSNWEAESTAEWTGGLSGRVWGGAATPALPPGRVTRPRRSTVFEALVDQNTVFEALVGQEHCHGSLSRSRKPSVNAQKSEM